MSNRQAKSSRQLVRLFRVHEMQGSVPEVPVYPHVDETLLYENDPDPTHLVLAITEVGATSDNRLYYDEALVAEIEQQLPGLGGIQGHVPDADLDSAFPVEVVDWIGHLRIDGNTWAKCYIPPGPTREFVRRIKARGGKIGTSIFGPYEKRETVKPGTWTPRGLTLESLDLAPASRASLKVGQPFALTREMIEEEIQTMDRQEVLSSLTANEIPSRVREQIVREAQVTADAAEVRDLRQRVAELERHGSIVAELTTFLGPDTDVVAVVREMYQTLENLRQAVGENGVDIAVRVNEYQARIAELEQVAVDAAINDRVAELTDWPVANASEQGRAQLEALRGTLRRGIAAELTEDISAERIAEIATQVMESHQPLAEMVMQALAGPPAAVPGKPAVQGDDAWRNQFDTEEGRNEFMTGLTNRR